VSSTFLGLPLRAMCADTEAALRWHAGHTKRRLTTARTIWWQDRNEAA